MYLFDSLEPRLMYSLE
ncbi:LEPR-XLL domain-containing protein [Listeria monocytogenes]